MTKNEMIRQIASHLVAHLKNGKCAEDLKDNLPPKEFETFCLMEESVAQDLIKMYKLEK